MVSYWNAHWVGPRAGNEVGYHPSSRAISYFLGSHCLWHSPIACAINGGGDNKYDIGLEHGAITYTNTSYHVICNLLYGHGQVQ